MSSTNIKPIVKNNNNNKTNNTIHDDRLNNSAKKSVLKPSHIQASSNNSNNDDWTSLSGKRLHSNSSEPSSPNPSQNKTKNKKLFISKNRFEALTQLEPTDIDAHASNDTSVTTNNAKANPQPERTTHLPPPIIVKGTKDFISLRSEFIDLIGSENFSFKSTLNNLKIQTKNPDSYRAVIHFLQDNEAEFHTYQMEENKAYRIVIRNLHPTTNTTEIRLALEEIGFQVRQVTNILHKTTKINLPIFFVDLEPSETNKDIFHVNQLLHTKVKIEEPYKRRDLVQCLNCQEYGHTKTYCAHSPRCVRCAEYHPSSTCQKLRNLPAKCALCQGDHPANYRGCHIHKDLQKLRSHPRSNQSTATNHLTKRIPEKTPSAEHNPPPPRTRTYANVTSNQEPPMTTNIQTDTGTILSKFISDFQALINPLLSLLTTVLAKLASQNDK